MTLSKLTLFLVALPVSLFASDCFAQRFETLQEAASDPLVVELIGEEKLKSFFKAEREGAASSGHSLNVGETHRIYAELSETVRMMAADFADRRWSQDKRTIEFDAEKFLLSLEKLKLIRDKSPYANLAGYLQLAIDTTIRKVEADHRLFAWDVYTRSITPQSPGVKSLIERNYFVVPMALSAMLNQKSRKGYDLAYDRLRAAYKNSGGTFNELAGPVFEKMQTMARQEAASWYRSSRSGMEKKISMDANSFQRAWYVETVLPEISTQARVRIIKLNSKANSRLNSARNGLKYAIENAESAITSAEQTQEKAAQIYLNDARESALEGLAATSELADTVQQMRRLRQYMIPYVEHHTQLKHVASMTLETLMKARNAMPSKGNQSANRNVIGFLIDATKMLSTAEGKLHEAEEMTSKAKPVILASEKKTGALLAAKADAKTKAAEKTFDVSSRQAFDLSMSELAQTLPPDKQVKFYQKWGKLIQNAIAAEPTLMANESKYMSFIKKNFKGKTASDVIKD